MSTHLLKTARVATPPQQHTDTTRLLARWCELTAAVAAAAAHRPGEEHELFTMEQQVESVLRDRSPNVGRALDILLCWEASLIHHNDLPAGRCLICRRARMDATALPTQVGGAL
jgi:hypothetical protein